MLQIIDRRLNPKHKSAVNRERFLRRYRSQIKSAVAGAIRGRSITDMQSGEKITIPAKDIREPGFGHGRGGIWERVHPGNEDFAKGDEVERSGGGGGGGSGDGAGDGDSEDDFSFTLSKEEFLNYFFEDLELPNLVKTHLTASDEHKLVRAGYTADGVPTNIHIVRSLKGAIGRRVALAGPLIAKVRELETQLDAMRADPADRMDEIAELQEQIHHLRARILRIPFIDTFDLRYSNRVRVPKPRNQAVMFCLMDVSGSMDESRKDMAKRFFILLYLFLQRAYDKIEVVFIRHHTQASEVDEETFFHSRESGGTVVSSALEKMLEVIDARYPANEGNIYGAQASDGDNWDNDSPMCRDLLAGKLLPLCQYYAYIEITQGQPQNLWREYDKLRAWYRHFAMQRIGTPADIYPVFRERFRKQQRVSE
ncbi:MAG TPA: YeaH/YhbH family protein [Arenimonas sp.]|nr:YeaH/YhbH family protein [Arenimonas sp.]